MARVPMVDPEKLTGEEKEVLDAHLAKGYFLTNEKLTLLHSAPAFIAIEEGSYTASRELIKVVGERAADMYEYVISTQNDCIVCSTYFRKKFLRTGVDLETFEPTDDEKLLIEFAKALADDPMHIPTELKDRMQARWNDHEFVTIVAQGLMMLANNYYNEIMEVDV